MDTTFYDDSGLKGENNNIMKGVKRPGSLALDGKSLKSRVDLLTSEDVKCISTPTLTQILISNSSTSNLPSTKTPLETYINPTKPVTDAQKEYVLPFEQRLAELHGQTSSPPLNAFQIALTNVPSGSSTVDISSDAASTSNDSYSVNNSSDSRCTYDTEFNLANIKEEPQTVPQLNGSGTPPVSPIDMRDQERIKLERKRLRNRIAASKCRKRKIERITKLEDEVKVLKNENSGLSMTIAQLRDQVKKLHQEVNNHVNSGCKLDVSILGNGALSLYSRS